MYPAFPTLDHGKRSLFRSRRGSNRPTLTDRDSAHLPEAPQNRTLPRVVSVGFNKCATRVLGQMFARAGHEVVSHALRDSQIIKGFSAEGADT